MKVQKFVLLLVGALLSLGLLGFGVDGILTQKLYGPMLSILAGLAAFGLIFLMVRENRARVRALFWGGIALVISGVLVLADATVGFLG